MKSEPNLRERVVRNVSDGAASVAAAAAVAAVGTIGCVNVFDVRREMVITQSRGLFLFEWALMVDVLKDSLM